MTDPSTTDTPPAPAVDEVTMTPRRRIRTWKQRWDPAAPLKFTRRMFIGTKAKPYVPAGTELTPAMRKRFGLARLRRWWNIGILTRADAPPTTRRGNPAG